MPVKKYKSFEDAERDLWIVNPDEAYLKRAFEMIDFGRNILKRNYPKGKVFKFKSIEEAQAFKIEDNL
jgi:hypothetical protein